MLGFSGLSQTPISSLQGVVASTYTLSLNVTSYSQTNYNLDLRFNKAVKVNIATYSTVYNNLSYNYYQGKILSITGQTYSISSSLKPLAQKRIVPSNSNYSSTYYNLVYHRTYNCTLEPLSINCTLSSIVKSGKYKVIDGVDYTQINYDLGVRSNKRLILDTTPYNQVNSTANLVYIRGLATHPTVTHYSLSNYNINALYNKVLVVDNSTYSTGSALNVLNNRKIVLTSSALSVNSSLHFTHEATFGLQTAAYLVSSTLNILQNRVLELNTYNGTLTTNDINLKEYYRLPIDSTEFVSTIQDAIFIDSETIDVGHATYTIGGGLTLSYLRGRILDLTVEDYSISSSINLQYRKRIVVNTKNYLTSGSLQLQWGRKNLTIPTTSITSIFNNANLDYFNIIISPIDMDDISILVLDNLHSAYVNIEDIGCLDMMDMITTVSLDSYTTSYQNINTINNIISPDNINSVENISTITQLIKE
jgi:hypothetical protein